MWYICKKASTPSKINYTYQSHVKDNHYKLQKVKKTIILSQPAGPELYINNTSITNITYCTKFSGNRGAFPSIMFMIHYIPITNVSFLKFFYVSHIRTKQTNLGLSFSLVNFLTFYNHSYWNSLNRNNKQAEQHKAKVGNLHIPVKVTRLS